MSPPLLQARALTRRFGGLNALQDVSLSIADLGIHGLIGPNGAGKSTLINLLSGDLAPDRGCIVFRGRDITPLSIARTARLGIVRSYQKTNIFAAFTCFENCWLGTQRHEGAIAGFLSRPRASKKTRGRALDALEKVGLASRAQCVAGVLSHGERRRLEIAMLLTQTPKIMLLDEPLAGLGAVQSDGIVALIKDLSTHLSIVLVEHDLDAVFVLADEITVLDGGRILANGPAAAIRSNDAVRKAYLGQ